MRHYRLAGAVVAAGALLFAGACGGDDSGGGSDDAVTVGSLPFAQYAAPAYMGEPEIEDEIGLDIEVNQFSRAVDAIEALRAGRIDVAFGGIGTFVPTYLQGTDVKLVGSVGYGGYQLVAREEAGVSDYPDLEGKRIGLTRGALEVLVSAALSDAGLTGSPDDPNADVELVFLAGTPDMTQALARGDVDAIFQSEPDATTAIEQGFGVAVKDPYDTSAGPVTKVIMMSQDLYEDRDRAVKFLEGIVLATNRLCEDPEMREEFTREEIFGGQLSAEDYTKATENAPLDVTKLTVEEVQNNADLLQQVGITEETIDAAEAVDLSLLEDALANVDWGGEC